MFIAERDGLITLDIPTGGPTMMTRAPLARQQESHRLIAAPEIVDGVEMILPLSTSTLKRANSSRP